MFFRARCCVFAAFFGGALALLQPALVAAQAELSIRVTGRETPPRWGRAIPLNVIVRNLGDEPATVSPVYFHPSGDYGLAAIPLDSEVATIEPGETTTLNLPFTIKQQDWDARIGGRFATIVTLLDRSGFSPRPETPRSRIEENLWRDSNEADHQDVVQLTIPEPEYYLVKATLVRLIVNDKCDHVSPGDWYVELCMDNPSGAYGLQTDFIYPGDRACFSWPRRGTENVENGDRLTLNLHSPEMQVRGRESIAVDVWVHDCDAVGGDANHPGHCLRGEEEFPELKQPAAIVGRVWLPYRNQSWKRAKGVLNGFRSEQVASGPNYCSAGAFTAQIQVDWRTPGGY